MTMRGGGGVSPSHYLTAPGAGAGAGLAGPVVLRTAPSRTFKGSPVNVLNVTGVRGMVRDESIFNVFSPASLLFF